MRLNLELRVVWNDNSSQVYHMPIANLDEKDDYLFFQLRDKNNDLDWEDVVIPMTNVKFYTKTVIQVD